MSFSSPGSAANAGEALYQRWTRRIWSNRNWVKLYWPAMLWAAWVAAGLALMVHGRITGGSLTLVDVVPEAVQRVWHYALVIIRIHLVAIPGLVVAGDFRTEQWSVIRASPMRTGAVFWAMFKLSWWHGVLPYGVLMLAEMALALTYWHHPDVPPTALHFILLAAVFLAVGFTWAGLGYLGGQVFRRPFGVLLGACVPVASNILVNILLGLSISNWLLTLVVLTGLFTFPETFLALLFVWAGAFEVATAMNHTLFGQVLMPAAVAAVVVWAVLEKVLAWRRRRG